MESVIQSASRRLKALVEPPPVLVRTGAAVRCGQAKDILSNEMKDWLTKCLGCVAGRREFLANRYFAVEVRAPGDVIAGWRHFMAALERRETVACLYVFPSEVAPDVSARKDAATALENIARAMSVLADQPAEVLLRGGQLNHVITLACPVTSCRTAYFDFDAVAFVPQAEDPSDPLYDPLMAAPVPLVNINSDIYGFSMFTRDHAQARFGCEIGHLTRRERRYIFAQAAEIWQRMAERTISNYAALVDQKLCPTYLTEQRDYWVANHRDPAFAELEKRPYLHEMPAQYAPRVVQVWEEHFERGVTPSYRHIASEGAEMRAACPHDAR